MPPEGTFLIPSPAAAQFGEPLTIADVLLRIDTDAGLSAREKGEMRSALRVLCRWLGSEPAAVPADLRHLRKGFQSLSAAKVEVSRARFGNARSLTLKALKRVGIKAMPGRARERLSSEWEVLRARLPDRRFASGLSRFMTFCSSHAIAPHAVDAAVFERFRLAYENDSLLRDPGGMHRDTCKLWNRAAAGILGWPKLTVEVPVRRRNFALPLIEFPESFGEDMERFLSQSVNPDVFSDSYAKPVRPLTVRNRRRNILMAATALARSGIPITEITGLNVLVQVNHAKAALRVLLERAGDRTTGHIHQVAALLKTIARHYVRVDPTAVEKLRALCSKLKPKQAGLTEKNKHCLRQFADMTKLAALLTLPQQLLAESDRHGGDQRRDAVRVALALAIGIELAIPIRAQNLAGLRLDQHIHRAGSKVFLSIPAEQTKNENAIDAELPSWLIRLLDAYLRHYRPQLVSTTSPWLFPGEEGARRNSGGFGSQISAAIAKTTGITMTVHQFRHLAAKLYLDRHPGDYETVRRLLGHKSLATTLRFYRELDAALAVQRYGDLLSQLFEEVTICPVPKRQSRRRGGDHAHA